MAGLYEMVLAAERKAASDQAASPLHSGADALAGGFTKGFNTRFGDDSAMDTRTKQLQQAKMILEKQKQIQDLKRQAMNDKVTRRMLVKAGYLSDAEARRMDNDDLNKDSYSQRDTANTNLATVADLAKGNKEAAQRKMSVSSDASGNVKVEEVEEEKKSVAQQKRDADKENATTLIKQGKVMHKNKLHAAGSEDDFLSFLAQSGISINDPAVQAAIQEGKARFPTKGEGVWEWMKEKVMALKGRISGTKQPQGQQKMSPEARYEELVNSGLNEDEVYRVLAQEGY